MLGATGLLDLVCRTRSMVNLTPGLAVSGSVAAMLAIDKGRSQMPGAGRFEEGSQCYGNHNTWEHYASLFCFWGSCLDWVVSPSPLPLPAPHCRQ